LRLGTQCERRDFRHDGVRGRPDTDTCNGDDEHEHEGGDPANDAVVVEAARDAHSGPDDGDGPKGPDGEAAAVEMRERPCRAEVGNEAEDDADDEEQQTVSGFHADLLEEVRRRGEERQTKHGREEVGPDDDEGAAEVGAPEALCVCCRLGDLVFFLDGDADLFENDIGVVQRREEVLERCAGLVHPVLSDEPCRALRDDECDGEGNDGKEPLHAQRDEVSLFVHDAVAAKDSNGAEELTEQVEGREQSHGGASQAGGDNLRHVGQEHHLDEGKRGTLNNLSDEQHATHTGLSAGLVGQELDQDAEDGNDTTVDQALLTTDAVLTGACGNGCAELADGGEGLPHGQPDGGDDPLLFAILNLVENAKVALEGV